MTVNAPDFQILGRNELNETQIRFWNALKQRWSERSAWELAESAALMDTLSADERETVRRLAKEDAEARTKRIADADDAREQRRSAKHPAY